MIKIKLTWPQLSRRRTPTYTRVRRRRTKRMRAHVAREVDTGDVIFDQPTELPVAVARAKRPGMRVRQMVAELGAWGAARWQWFRPRLVPTLVATACTLAIAASTDYLVHGGAARPHQSTHVTLYRPAR